MEEKQQRNSSVELLRIVAMLFIVLSHLCVHNGIVLNTMPLSVNKIFMQWGTLGNLGVDIFVIITGYFVSTKSFSAKRLSTLLSQVWFYSIVLALAIFFAFDINLGLKDILRVILPTVFVEYWFFTAYIVLVFISPFLNILIENLSRVNFLRFLLSLIALWVVIPTFTTKNMYGSEIPQFILLYLIGAYFKKYPDNLFAKKRVRVFVTAVCWSLLLLSTVCINLLSSMLSSALSAYGAYFFARNSLLIVGIAVGMFAIACYGKPFTNRFINTVSSCTFGVYLIHDNPLVRQVLWTRIFNIKEIYNSSLFIPYAFLIVLTVFLACTLIEFLRLKTVAKPFSSLIEKIIQFIVRKFLDLYNWFLKISSKF